MIDFQIYKILHMLGLAMLLIGLSGVVFIYAVATEIPAKMKSLTFTFHGVGLFLMLLGGFGMLARLGLIGGLPLWIYAKLAIWLIFGAAAALAKRKLMSTKAMASIFSLLVALAAYLAIYKPF